MPPRHPPHFCSAVYRLHRAGRFTRSQGKLTLTISGDNDIADYFLEMGEQLTHN